MSVGSRTQLGVIDESVYGTAVVVTKFFEFNSEAIKATKGRIDSAALRAGQRVQRNDRSIITNEGAAGPVTFEVHSKGFGWWLKHLLGTVATTGPTDLKYIHTGTVGSMLGQSFDLQVNRPFYPADTDQAFTYTGGKVAKWKLSNSVKGLLMLEITFDFQDESLAIALAAPSYLTATELLAYVGGVLTIGGSAVDVTDFSVEVDNQLKLDRQYLRGDSKQKEPVEGKYRTITWSATADFSDTTQYARYKSLTTAGAYAQIVATWNGSILIGTASLPSVVVTLPAARFDGNTPNIKDGDPLQIPLSGVAHFDGTNSPISVAYGTSDATP